VKSTKLWLNSILDFIYPRYCAACNNLLLLDEQEICLSCDYELPRTNFHQQKDHLVEQLFWGKVQLEFASSYLYYTKGNITQQVIQNFKYHGRKNIGYLLGKQYGYEVKDYLKNIDFIVPIPLHKKKQKLRGFNQSEYFGKGLSESLQIPQETNLLVRNVYTETQTKRSRIDRWQNVESIFEVVEKEKPEGKHILLVDDIVTTGSTLEAAANSLQKYDNVKISVLTLGVAVI
jgi:ComF family protein